MKRLLRGVIDFEDDKISKDALNSNWTRLGKAQEGASGLRWMHPVDEQIYKFVREFFLNNFDLPTATTLKDFFHRDSNVEVLERLTDVEAAPVHARAQYGNLVDTVLEDQHRLQMQALLKDASEIVSKGREVQEGRQKRRLRGVQDALDYVHARSHLALPQPKGERTKGNLDTEEERERYARAKADPSSAYGTLMGINAIDTVCHGLRPGELWVHAGSTGDFKTGMALNWVHRAATRYKTNVVYVSLEMPRKQLQRMLCVLHSAQPTFRAQGKLPLDQRKVRDGELDEADEAFYGEVLADLRADPNHCKIHLWAPDRQVTIQDIEAELAALNREMEIGMVVIDHTELVGRPTSSRDNYGTQINDIIRATKRLALQHDGGRGVGVLLLHQLNREGRKAAEKAGGRYGLYHLSYAHEAERSADVVTTSFLDDELRQSSQLLLSNPKNRDNPHFPDVRLNVDWRSRRLYEGPSATPPGMVVADMLDGAL